MWTPGRKYDVVCHFEWPEASYCYVYYAAMLPGFMYIPLYSGEFTPPTDSLHSEVRAPGLSISASLAPRHPKKIANDTP